MEYKGIKLTEVTGSQIVDPPKEMFVWDCDPGCLLRAYVLAIVNGRENGYPVITKTGTYRHCAEIPKEPKPRRATNRELSKWLAKGHGEYTNTLFTASYSTYTYLFDSEESEVSYNILVRKWDDVGWHEPTVDYMDIE